MSGIPPRPARREGCIPRIASMRNVRGMTVVELLIAVAILGILVTLAAPSFQHQVVSANVSSAVNTFMSDLRFARSEAVRRGSAVVVCRSDSPEATTPACGSGSGANGNWVSGWVVFDDRDGDGSFSTGDLILRVQSPLKAPDAITEATAGSTKFQFTALGRQKSLNNATTITFGQTIDTRDQRVICVNWAGRVRIAGPGGSTC